MRSWYERMELTGEVQHTVITREPDGVISGITDTVWAPYRRAIIHQAFTGVRPDARGRGLGKWIKAAMLLHLRDLYPEARWVATDNAGSNAPMLKINRALGFKPYRHETDYQITRDELAKRLLKR
jgi:GNAT superfamily N-acetyltransferase